MLVYQSQNKRKISCCEKFDLFSILNKKSKYGIIKTDRII